MADIFDFSNPNTMGLLGAMAGLGQAAMPSRLPVPLASVFGQAASGMAQGAQAAQAYQKAATENTLQKLTLQGWQNYMNAMGGQPPQQPQASQPMQMPQEAQTPAQPATTPTGLDLSKLTPYEQAYLARKDPTAFSNGIQDFQNTSIQAANPPIPPGVKTPIPAGMTSGQGQAALDPLAMLEQARRGMFPGGPGAAMFGPAASLYEKTLGQGYQGVRMPDGSLGVAPLNGIDRVRFMLANNEALGKSMGEKQQGINAAGEIAPLPGSLSSAQQSAYAGEYGKSQGGLPAELTKIGAQGAETRNNAAFDAQVQLAKENELAKRKTFYETGVIPPDYSNPNAQTPTATAPSSDGKQATPRGTVVPAPLSQGPYQGADAIKKQNELTADAEKNFGALRGNLEGTEGRMMALAKAFQAVQTGGLATKRQEISNVLRGAGFNWAADKVMNENDVTAVQKALGLQVQDVLGQLKQMNAGTGGKVLNSEFNNLLHKQYGPDLTPEANFDLLKQGLAGVYQTKNMIDDYYQYGKPAGWRDANAFQSAYYKQPENGWEKMVDQAGKTIGPLKGMAGAKSTTPGIPQAAIDHLKAHPELAMHFDDYYGANASKKVLGGQ